MRAVPPVLRRRLAKGLEIADAVLAESIDARQRLVHDFEEQVLAGNDVAVLPVMAILTPSAAECDPASERFSPRTLYALSRFTRFVNRDDTSTTRRVAAALSSRNQANANVVPWSR